MFTEIKTGQYIGQFTWTRPDGARQTDWTPGAKTYPHARTLSLIELLEWTKAKLAMVDMSKPGLSPTPPCSY